MAEFSVVDADTAPKPIAKNVGRLNARKTEYEEYISKVPVGKVGRIVPASPDTARGIALRLARAGKRIGKSLNVWMTEDATYFKVLDATPAPVVKTPKKSKTDAPAVSTPA